MKKHQLEQYIKAKSREVMGTPSVISDAADQGKLIKVSDVQKMLDVLEDYLTHHNDFKNACQKAQIFSDGSVDKQYWRHQMETLDRIQEGVEKLCE